MMTHSERVKKGKTNVERRNNNYRFTFGKFKGKLIRKVIETEEGLNYCIWLCKTKEKDYNAHYEGGFGFSKTEIRKDRLYLILKFHLKKVKKYKKHLYPTIDAYGYSRRKRRKMIKDLYKGI
tara:strand:- start:533 stop:898 length:366 start_codon:yes stop_codon:yes gene_type:complete